MHKNSHSLGYWTLGVQFLKLAEQSCTEIAISENRHVVVSDQALSPSRYQELTHWSDHSIGVPVVFNFFHGIELILKGLLAVRGVERKHHRLTKLVDDFEDLFPNTLLACKLRQALPRSGSRTPMSRFLTANSIEIDEWFQALKYPISTQGRIYKHADLKYGGESTVPFWRNIAETAIDLRKTAVDFARSQGYA